MERFHLVLSLPCVGHGSSFCCPRCHYTRVPVSDPGRQARWFWGGDVAGGRASGAALASWSFFFCQVWPGLSASSLAQDSPDTPLLVRFVLGGGCGAVRGQRGERAALVELVS